MSFKFNWKPKLFFFSYPQKRVLLRFLDGFPGIEVLCIKYILLFSEKPFYYKHKTKDWVKFKREKNKTLRSPTALLTVVSFNEALLLIKPAALEDKFCSIYFFTTKVMVTIGGQASLPDSTLTQQGEFRKRRTIVQGQRKKQHLI